MLSTASVKTIIFRSLYHCDAHEKIAKLFGIWIHGCVDGYSRYIVYLRAATDKKSQTVEDIFVDACNGWPNGFGVGTPEQTGWASRVRVDKGTENVGLMLRQVERHYDPADPSTLTRGSAITGRSTENCRIEYIWRSPCHGPICI